MAPAISSSTDRMHGDREHQRQERRPDDGMPSPQNGESDTLRLAATRTTSTIRGRRRLVIAATAPQSLTLASFR